MAPTAEVQMRVAKTALSVAVLGSLFLSGASASAATSPGTLWVALSRSSSRPA